MTWTQPTLTNTPCSGGCRGKGRGGGRRGSQRWRGTHSSSWCEMRADGGSPGPAGPQSAAAAAASKPSTEAQRHLLKHKQGLRPTCTWTRPCCFVLPFCWLGCVWVHCVLPFCGSIRQQTALGAWASLRPAGGAGRRQTRAECVTAVCMRVCEWRCRCPQAAASFEAMHRATPQGHEVASLPGSHLIRQRV